MLAMLPVLLADNAAVTAPHERRHAYYAGSGHAAHRTLLAKLQGFMHPVVPQAYLPALLENVVLRPPNPHTSLCLLQHILLRRPCLNALQPPTIEWCTSPCDVTALCCRMSLNTLYSESSHEIPSPGTFRRP